MNMLKFLAILFFVIDATSCLSQIDFRDGYIITLNQDTVRGLIAYGTAKSRSQVGLFKPFRLGEIIKFTSRELVGYGYTGSYVYRSVVIPKYGSMFALSLLDGPMPLYKFGNNFYGDNGTLVEISKSNYLNALHQLTSDCSTQQISPQTKYTRKDITSVFTTYNNCRGKNIVISEGLYAKRNEFYLAASFISTQSVISKQFASNSNYFTEIEDFSAKGAELVMGWQLSLPTAISNKWLILAELKLFWLINTETTTKNPFNNFPIPTTKEVSIPGVSVPFGLKYNLRNPKSTPTIGGGFFHRTYFDPKMTASTKFGNNLVNDLVYDFSSTLPNWGMWLGFGFNKYNSKNKRKFFDIKYENGWMSGESKINSWAFSVGGSF